VASWRHRLARELAGAALRGQLVQRVEWVVHRNPLDLPEDCLVAELALSGWVLAVTHLLRDYS
jgi:hypothetical protein